MPTDPNWLLSAAAQVSATIVAVVGGFITARLLGLVSEKASMLSRRDEKQEEVTVLEQERERALFDFQSYRVGSFLDSVTDNLRDREPLPSLDEIRSMQAGEPLDNGLLAKEYEAVKDNIMAAREWVAEQVDGLTVRSLSFRGGSTSIIRTCPESIGRKSNIHMGGRGRG